MFLKRRRILYVSVLMALLLTGASVFSQSPVLRVQYLPTDEAILDPELFATRAAVLSALQAKDWKALRRWTHGNGHIEGLARSDQRTERLMEILAFGGRFVRPRREEFCAPYWNDDSGRLGGFLPKHLRHYEGEVWTVITPESVLRQRAAPDAPIVGRLRLEVVGLEDVPKRLRSSGDFRRYAWVTMGSVSGFVERSALRSVGLRLEDWACFTRVNHSWRLADIDVSLQP